MKHLDNQVDSKSKGCIKSHLLTVTDWQAELLVLPGRPSHSLRSWGKARPTLLVMGPVLERGNLLLKRSFVTIFSSYQCQHFTDAQVLMLPTLAFSLYQM